MVTFIKFSITSLKFITTARPTVLVSQMFLAIQSVRDDHSPRTRTMRFLKPTKLGVTSESWLRHEVLALECTAATCRYLLDAGMLDLAGTMGWDGSCDEFTNGVLLLLAITC